jgi:hypothetical protein
MVDLDMLAAGEAKREGAAQEAERACVIKDEPTADNLHA